jgi:hypothetical protein
METQIEIGSWWWLSPPLSRLLEVGFEFLGSSAPPPRTAYTSIKEVRFNITQPIEIRTVTSTITLAVKLSYVRSNLDAILLLFGRS